MACLRPSYVSRVCAGCDRFEPAVPGQQYIEPAVSSWVTRSLDQCHTWARAVRVVV